MTTTAKIEELQKSVINAINNSCLHPAVVRLVLLNVISMVEASEREVNKREKRQNPENLFLFPHNPHKI